MNYKPYKFLIIPVIQELDEDGNVVSELTPEQPIPVFGIAGLHTFADNFEEDLLQRVTEMQQRQSNVVMPNGAGQLAVPK